MNRFICRSHLLAFAELTREKGNLEPGSQNSSHRTIIPDNNTCLIHKT